HAGSFLDFKFVSGKTARVACASVEAGETGPPEAEVAPAPTTAASGAVDESGIPEAPRLVIPEEDESGLPPGKRASGVDFIGEPETDEAETVKPTGKLPDDFPGRAALGEAGINT